MATRSSSRLKVNHIRREQVSSGTNKQSDKVATTSESPNNEDTNVAAWEPITAFLRVRPHLPDAKIAIPYLKIVSDTEVQMTDPSELRAARSRLGSADAQYTFTHVFPPETTQQDFFNRTTLPLIKDVLNGSNCLLFAYGVTNSGKTFTVQGDSKEGAAGILPRSLSVLFESLQQARSNKKAHPNNLSRKQTVGTSRDDSKSAEYTREDTESSSNDDKIHNQVPSIDPAYAYSVWVSYSEVYNERVYDLLASSTPSPSPGDGVAGGFVSAPVHEVLGYTLAPGSNFRNLTFASQLPNNTSTLAQRKALAIKTDSDGRKFVPELKEMRVRSYEEANDILAFGQINRRVFGTLANQTSSRSHAIFTIKLVRVSADNAHPPRTSRFCIVDLAGSERSKNTQTSGDRLKEAGSINNSLMYLGQCLESMKVRQKKGPAGSATGDTRSQMFPFRRSKLTEMFQDFFIGNGKVTMIVNVNPCDTGFEENSRVMKFSALAREVKTGLSRLEALRANKRRTVLLSLCDSQGQETEERVVEILEEEADDAEDDNSDYEDCTINPLVDALFDEVEQLRIQLYECEIRAVQQEQQIREEVASVMQREMLEIERRWAKRWRSEVVRGESKMNQKLDMLHRDGYLGKSTKHIRDGDSQPKFTSKTLHEVPCRTPSPKLRSLDGSTETFLSPGPVRALYRKGDLGLFPEGSEDEAELTDESEEVDDSGEEEKDEEDDDQPDDVSSDYIQPGSSDELDVNESSSAASTTSTTSATSEANEEGANARGLWVKSKTIMPGGYRLSQSISHGA